MIVITGIIGFLASAMGIIMFVNHEANAGASLLVSGVLCLALSQHLNNQKRIIEILQDGFSPDIRYLRGWYQTIVANALNKDPQIKDIFRLRDFKPDPSGGYLCLITIGPAFIKAILSYEGDYKKLENWTAQIITESKPTASA